MSQTDPEMSSIRAFEPQDLDRIVELSLAAWAPVFASFRRLLGDQLFFLAYPDWRESQSRAVRSTCSSPETDVWVAIVDGCPVGFVASRLKLASEPLAGEIEMIAVDPDCQRSGIATRLLEHAIEHLHEAGVSLIEVATGGDPAHTPARTLYERAGFRALPLARYYRRP
jgi:ribosomal protein S18 acetylase RimI-like enzyme